MSSSDKSILPVGFLIHPHASLHDTGWGHPEHQGRLRAIASSVGKDLLALDGKVIQVEPGEIEEKDLLRVHTREHLEHLEEAVRLATAESRLVSIDSDTIVSPHSWEAACGSSAALVTAAKMVYEEELSTAFVATRPPGHHATADQAMGFCLINHVAIATRWLQENSDVNRVLIIDWDVHHGNGTQDIFYGDGSVYYFSLHQWPHFPGSGAVGEVGEGAGIGLTRNIPVRAGTSPAEYRNLFAHNLEQVLKSFEADFILISAGFDVMEGDPLGGLCLEPEYLHFLTTKVMHTASKQCGIVVALEGGYHPERTGLGVKAVLRALAEVE
ncbi:uncharacterized protein METZ01_LOCUS198076 [marine metagenome]|uniref:histone deacetylase n=1 Tax=marine metagenome TaxID=408172 RepID=A0A382E4C3_9ZZZZ